MSGIKWTEYMRRGLDHFPIPLHLQGHNETLQEILTQEAKDATKDAQNGWNPHPACDICPLLAILGCPLTVTHLGFDCCCLGHFPSVL